MHWDYNVKLLLNVVSHVIQLHEQVLIQWHQVSDASFICETPAELERASGRAVLTTLTSWSITKDHMRRCGFRTLTSGCHQCFLLTQLALVINHTRNWDALSPYWFAIVASWMIQRNKSLCVLFASTNTSMVIIFANTQKFSVHYNIAQKVSASSLTKYNRRKTNLNVHPGVRCPSLPIRARAV